MQTYRDPTFDEVARREAAAQRHAAIEADQEARRRAWKESDEYRRLRRQKIRRAVLRVMSGGPR